jgi:hypothetical protein
LKRVAGHGDFLTNYFEWQIANRSRVNFFAWRTTCDATIFERKARQHVNGSDHRAMVLKIKLQSLQPMFVDLTIAQSTNNGL